MSLSTPKTRMTGLVSDGEDLVIRLVTTPAWADRQTYGRTMTYDG